MNPLLNTRNDYTPIDEIVPVTPNDSSPLQLNGVATPCRAVVCTSAGNIAFLDGAGNSITMTFTASPQPIYIRMQKILNTGTTVTAGNIFACY